MPGSGRKTAPAVPDTPEADDAARPVDDATNDVTDDVADDATNDVADDATNDVTNDIADVVAGIDRADVPDAPARRPDPRDSEETAPDPGRDGVEGVRETGPDDWIGSDRETPDGAGSSRFDAP